MKLLFIVLNTLIEGIMIIIKNGLMNLMNILILNVIVDIKKNLINILISNVDKFWHIAGSNYLSNHLQTIKHIFLYKQNNFNCNSVHLFNNFIQDILF